MGTKFYDLDPAQFKRCWLDVPYANQDPRQVMDIYLPDEGEGPFPLIIFCNGGGWVQQNKRNNTMPGPFQAVSQGYALASISYRLAPGVTFPAFVYDVKAAIRFLRAHAAEYQLKTDKIAAWGNSAGGHILNTVAATGTRHMLEDLTMGNPEQSSSIQCLVSMYAPTDMYQLDLGNRISEEEAKNLTNTDVGQKDTREGMNFPHNMCMGFKLSRNPAGAAYGSPVNYVTEDFPPAYFMHGISDPVVPYTQSTCMWNMVNQTCGAGHAKLRLFEGADHGHPSMKTNEVTDELISFIDQYLWEREHVHTPLPDLVLLDD